MSKSVVSKAKPKAPRAPRRTLHVVRSHPQGSPHIDTMRKTDPAPAPPARAWTYQEISADLRLRWINEAAYRHYAERGYTHGHDLEDWLQAERTIDNFILDTQNGGA